MDLGLKGKWAVVCAASKGLGYACARALAGEGVGIVLVARTESTLRASAERIHAETGQRVIPVAADITTEQGRAEALAAAPQVDILVNNAGGPPTGDFLDFSREDWLAALNNNMLSHLEMIRGVIRPMVERRFGRIVNITSSAVKSPVEILCLTNGPRAGLTGVAGGLARQYARYNVTINGLLPGKFDTERLRSNVRARAEVRGVSFEQETQHQIELIAAKRYGRTEEFGQACAFLCSAGAGYITAQNILVDGGAFPGLL
ncbi:MAG: SDR family oxidoreductase [Burkholderiaceae bacterium]|uniref:SDR family oxidoreductase n=1 Tax=Castellaniella sp. TaxID=1955812 RepID=UPI00355F3909